MNNFSKIGYPDLNSKQDSPVYAFFDFDDTIVEGDSIIYWLAWVFKFYPRWRFFQVFYWIALFLCGIKIIKPQLLKRLFLLPTAYISPAVRAKMARSFVKEKLFPRFYEEVVTILKKHLSLGHKVVLISASGEFYLKFLTNFFPGIIVVGTKIQFPSSGLFRIPLYDTEYGNMKKEVKIRAIQNIFGVTDGTHITYGYSDSVSDRFLLDFVDNPVCVNPNPPLSRLAKEKNWPILIPTRSLSYFPGLVSKAIRLILCLDWIERNKLRKSSNEKQPNAL